MTGKILGKISFAEFGFLPDRPYLMGLYLGFHLGDGSGVYDGGRHLVNVSEACKWGSSEERNYRIAKTIDRIRDILKDAKVSHVSQLVGIPVEVELEENCFKDFRILTEVL